MSKYLSWEACNECVRETLPSGRVFEHIRTRRLICSEPSIDKVWFWAGGSTNPTAPMSFYIELISKDGQRYSQKLEGNEMETLELPEVDKWIESLTIKN